MLERSFWKRARLAVLLTVCLASPLAAQTELPLYVVGGGGGDMTSTATGARVTVGQGMIGRTSDGGTGAELGFWYPWLDRIATAIPVEPQVFLDRLLPNAPNPFNPSTTIRFSLAAEAVVQLDLYDLRGRRIDRLLDGKLPAGEHRLNYRADGMASGVYLLRLQAGNFHASQRIVLLK